MVGPGVTGDPGLPPLSVVVGARGPEAALEGFLASIAPQRGDAEVLVCESSPSSQALRERFAWARFIAGDGGLVPHLWRDGIDSSHGRMVALTNATMQPAPDWLQSLKHELDRHDVVSGAIEPGTNLRLTDWAEYFCRYSPHMLPFEGRPSADLPADNAAYRRECLESTSDLYREGFWEPAIHQRLASEGARLWQSPRVVVRQGRSAGFRAFVGQRLAHGRAYGAERGAELSAVQNLVRVLAAPLVVAVMTVRMAREIQSRRRLRRRFVFALPALLAFNLAWAAGEAIGHATRVRSS